VKSPLRKGQPRLKIYTLGYQGLSAELYVQALVNAGVGIVLDVREHAWSQRPEFVKSTLQKALAASGIQYAHIKAAGNPSQNRKTARSAAQCLGRYRTYLKTNTECLRALLTAIENAANSRRPACLTCFERSYDECHRSVLIEELNSLDSRLSPIHLEPFVDRQKKRIKPLSSAKTNSLLSNGYMAPRFLPFT
jgi:uncharacterized protein (DUF488 family)